MSSQSGKANDQLEKVATQVSESILRILTLCPKQETRQRAFALLGTDSGGVFTVKVEERVKAILGAPSQRGRKTGNVSAEESPGDTLPPSDSKLGGSQQQLQIEDSDLWSSNEEFASDEDGDDEDEKGERAEESTPPPISEWMMETPPPIHIHTPSPQRQTSPVRRQALAPLERHLWTSPPKMRRIIMENENREMGSRPLDLFIPDERSQEASTSGGIRKEGGIGRCTMNEFSSTDDDERRKGNEWKMHDENRNEMPVREWSSGEEDGRRKEVKGGIIQIQMEMDEFSTDDDERRRRERMTSGQGMGDTQMHEFSTDDDGREMERMRSEEGIGEERQRNDFSTDEEMQSVQGSGWETDENVRPPQNAFPPLSSPSVRSDGIGQGSSSPFVNTTSTLPMTSNLRTSSIAQRRFVRDELDSSDDEELAVRPEGAGLQCPPILNPQPGSSTDQADRIKDDLDSD